MSDWPRSALFESVEKLRNGEGDLTMPKRIASCYLGLPTSTDIQEILCEYKRQSAYITRWISSTNQMSSAEIVSRFSQDCGSLSTFQLRVMESVLNQRLTSES